MKSNEYISRLHRKNIERRETWISSKTGLPEEIPNSDIIRAKSAQHLELSPILSKPVTVQHQYLSKILFEGDSTDFVKIGSWTNDGHYLANDDIEYNRRLKNNPIPKYRISYDPDSEDLMVESAVPSSEGLYLNLIEGSNRLDRPFSHIYTARTKISREQLKQGSSIISELTFGLGKMFVGKNIEKEPIQKHFAKILPQCPINVISTLDTQNETPENKILAGYLNSQENSKQPTSEKSGSNGHILWGGEMINEQVATIISNIVVIERERNDNDKEKYWMKYPWEEAKRSRPDTLPFPLPYYGLLLSQFVYTLLANIDTYNFLLMGTIPKGLTPYFFAEQSESAYCEGHLTEWTRSQGYSLSEISAKPISNSGEKLSKKIMDLNEQGLSWADAYKQLSTYVHRLD